VDFDALIVDEVSRHFGRRRALSRVSFQVDSGRIFGLLGPNGAGKSTMLSILATLMRPSSGRVQYGAYQSHTHGAPLRKTIGVLGHDLFLYPELTALENLTFFAGLYGLRDGEDAARAALEEAGLADRADDLAGSLSRGMRQRLALERALIHRPRLILLDEPFTGLDDASTAALVRRLRALASTGAMVVLATHDLDLGDGLLDRAVFLKDGRIVDTADRPEGLRARYRVIMKRSEA
jgi:heme ABC exporter ATP-binding subunit CcmA